MIAHCVGGPWHGEDRAVKDGTPRLLGLKGPPPWPWEAGFNAADTVPFETFEYARRGEAAGYSVYEYVEPTAEVEIVIRKRVPKSKVETTRAELVRGLDLPPGGRLYYSGPARD